MIYNNITELIGNTPVIKLNRMVDKDSADVFVKVESFNPSGSVKDRAALSMIETAEKEGILKPGATIIEPTSGNTGIGLAMVAAAKGYKLIIIMPATATAERVKLLKAYGAEVILTPGEELMSGSIRKAQSLLKEIADSFMPNQFENMSNPEIHKRTTALEILNQMERKLDAFVATAGTGGTISGTGEVLRKHLPHLKIYVVESKNSPVIAGGKPGPHNIIGTGPGFIPKTLDMNIFDEIIHVTDEEAIATTKDLATKEGILCGISAGASTFVALQMARKLGPGKRVLSMIPDTGERYLSTGFL
ncbi:cysteine synthase A [Serpentinicella sp. ANB-PHB4]|uniref:cysteine synthase A n=1 Tax=Serpentinicella sp. ANB-PHB4 TaxID=3074076 RepID=UPI0028596754|nr:cysteine synthase A [Serpentinicella sp. ANB-PHB4]MDR5659242.1 cysteine synthase A [Serpentinicella sp. ANB-PHB4]